MSDFAGSSKKSTDSTPGVDADDFAAPDDFAGDDLAAELQRVLDEARSELDLDEDGQPTGNEAADDVLAGHDADQFETLEQVVAQAPPAEPVDTEAAQSVADESVIEDDPEAFEKQLQLLLSAAATQNEQPAANRQAASAVIESLDEAVADADAVTDQIKEMNELIERAAAQPAVLDSDDDDMVTVEQIARLMEQANSGSVAETPAVPVPAQAAATPTPESLNQLDEFLAGHADHAVADAFETVEDVVSQVAMPSDSVLQDAGTSEDVDGHANDSFATPDELASDASAQITNGGARTPAASNGASAGSTQGKADKTAPAQSATASLPLDSNLVAVSSDRSNNLLRKAGRIVIVCKSAAYRACAIVNSPLRNASSSTRKTIGIIGLLTLGNASLLIFGKVIASLMG